MYAVRLKMPPMHFFYRMKRANLAVSILNTSLFRFLSRRTVHDGMTGTDFRLSDEQVDLVHRLQQGKFGDVNFDEYEVLPNTNPRAFLDTCGLLPFL